MFNEYGVYQMMKLHQEEIERKAQNAWKIGDFQKDTFFQKLVKKFKSRHQSTTINTNCDCVSCC